MNGSKFNQMVDDAIKVIEKSQPQHPQLIEGTLYVTPEQHEMLKSIAASEPSYPWVGNVAALALGSVPIVEVQPNETIELPSGKLLIHSAIMGGFYVIEPHIDFYQAPVPIDFFPDGRYPLP